MERLQRPWKTKLGNIKLAKRCNYPVKGIQKALSVLLTCKRVRYARNRINTITTTRNYYVISI